MCNVSDSIKLIVDATVKKLDIAEKVARRVLEDDEILKAVSPFNKTHVYLAKAVLHLSEAVLDAWTKDGINCFDGDESPLDIVSEWEEPRPKPKLMAFINMYDGTVRMFNSDSKLDFFRAPWLDEP